jgi:hypothetical protein
MRTFSTPATRWVPAGALGGLVGALAMAAFLVVWVYAIPGKLAYAPEYFANIATIATGGRNALPGGESPALGFAGHLFVGMLWGIGYAWIATTRRQLVARPVVSALAFGLIVYFAMQAVLVFAGAYRTPRPEELAVQLVAHCVFFGLPVAYVTARRLPAA